MEFIELLGVFADMHSHFLNTQLLNSLFNAQISLEYEFALH
jgi:hypothetical protein